MSSPLRAIAITGLLVAAPATARADRERALSVSAGPASWVHDDAGPTLGGAAQLTIERAVTDAWWWRVDLAGGVHAIDGTSWSAVAGAGVMYRFDVLKYVPYALLELGGAAVGGGPMSETDDSTAITPLVLGGVGLDVLRSRDASWGVEARAGGLLGDTAVFSVAARYTWRWGYF